MIAVRRFPLAPPPDRRQPARRAPPADFSKRGATPSGASRSRARPTPCTPLAREDEAPVCFYSGLSKLRPVVYHNTRARGFYGLAWHRPLDRALVSRATLLVFSTPASLLAAERTRGYTEASTKHRIKPPSPTICLRPSGSTVTARCCSVTFKGFSARRKYSEAWDRETVPANRFSENSLYSRLGDGGCEEV